MWKWMVTMVIHLSCVEEERGEVYLCGVTMVLGRKGRGGEGEELTPSPPTIDALSICAAIWHPSQE